MTIPSLALPPFWPILLALLLFGGIGFRRGWIKEVATLGGVLLAWLLVVAVGMTFVAWANKVALVVSFTWDGGFDAADPAGMLRSLRAAPPIDPWQPEAFLLAIFAIGVAAAYVVGSRLSAHPRVVSDALLGALAGALNGYLLSFVALGYLQAAQRPTPAGVADGAALLGGYATTLAIVAVVGVVGIALATMLRSGGREPKRAGRAGG